MPGLISRRDRRRPLLAACFCLPLLISALPAQAALTLSATRIVFDADKRSASIVVNNPSDRPFAVQTWVNTSADDTSTAVPFIPSPPLFRLDPGKDQQVQINGLPNALPTDRESLFFFNVQEIPEANGQADNVLNIALRTRIKFFYRPTQVQGHPSARLGELQWTAHEQDGVLHLQVHNPTPFHYTFSRLEVSDNGRTHKLQQAPMLEPFTHQRVTFDGVKHTPGLQVTFSTINDFGGTTTPLHASVQAAP
ncbi:molecular chaperone [Pseudomonas sp. R5(2019)]|uniref:fimbrial biogenesis chaperone n=1 Tax=Pseudomonas sp. R5(2019) TaxID=2697566 RepID=UPI00141253A9|nr:molecular chaperone [Pseudomonas sp. R5(2019)]NBA97396.1 fimbria/pilus periplasmic chaperone [Pseudomonas sp. R5(2019)]